MNSPTSLSAVIPVFNEAPGLKDTLERLKRVLSQAQRLSSFEIIVVDDGSTDGAFNQWPTDEHVRLLRHPQNQGYGASLKTGISQSKYPLIMICDADGSYALESLPLLLQSWEDQRLVVAQRDRIPYPKYRWAKMILRFCFYIWLFLITFRNIKDINSGFRLFSKDRVLSFMEGLSDRFSFTTGLTLHWIYRGWPVIYVPTPYQLRKGSSKVNFARDSFRVFQQSLHIARQYHPIRLVILALAILGLGGLLVLWR